MSRAKSQAEIVFEEQLVPYANRLVIKKNNQHVALESTITDTMLRFVVGIIRHYKLYKSNSKMHSKEDDLPLTRLSIIVDNKFKFKMEIPAIMIDDAFKKTTGYKYYKAKKVESENEANVPKPFKKNIVPRKTRSLTVTEETVAAKLAKFVNIKEPHTLHRQRSQLRINSQIDEDVADMYAQCWKQKKQPVTGEGSSDAHTKYYNSEMDSDAILYSLCSDTLEESTNKTDDADKLDMDLTDDNLVRYDDAGKINFKKANAQKFKDYDQKLEALTNFNVSKAFEKVVQERVLTEIKKLLPTHIPKAIANYVRSPLNIFVLEVMQNNQISLFTKSSTSVDDLSDMDLKLKLLNRTHENKTQAINQKHYDSILLDQEALDAQKS
ncbi:hypothetical protein Tco_1310664 [Tanacetum coccineum]